jgi:hypothetical protein
MGGQAGSGTYSTPYSEPVRGGDIVTGELPRRGDQLRRDANGRPIAEGIITNSLRKYVKMRGESNLVDIPQSKLTELGTTHADIFKGPIGDIKTLIRHKIIDPVALLQLVKQELKGGLKKSAFLYVKADESPFVKSRTSEKDLRKSLVKRIKRLRNERESFVSKL